MKVPYLAEERIEHSAVAIPLDDQAIGKYGEVVAAELGSSATVHLLVKLRSKREFAT